MRKLMKILLLNHHIDAQHKISSRLQAAGAVLLVTSNSTEAWKMIQLHGASLDLAIIHREGESDDAMEDGERLVARIKADPAQADLPIIFTSSLWNESDFYQHQQSSAGANAYLRWPFTDDELIETIETMFGNSIRFAASTITTTHSKLISQAELLSKQASPKLKASQMEVRLEESADSAALGGLELKLEMPPTEEPSDPGSAGLALSLEPPMEQATSGSRPAPTVPITGSDPNEPATTALALAPAGLDEGLLELPDLMDPKRQDESLLSDLESYERLEIDQQIKQSTTEAPAALELSPEPAEFGTTVLDPAVVGLSPAASSSPSPSEFQLSDPKAPAFQSPPTALSTIDPISASKAGIFQDEASESERKAQEESRPVHSPAMTHATSDDSDLASDLPYLFSSKNKPVESSSGLSSALVFSEPVGDAVIPGGAVNSPDVETLKKYLMLREQDVAVLSNQLKSSRDQVSQLEKTLREELGKGNELEHMVAIYRKRTEEFEKEKQLALQGLQTEIDELKFQNKAKSDKARVLEAKVGEATEEIERLKERVRTDIRKIRVREKELENKLEIVRKDSEALITSREAKIMELKRKIDLLEFNIDLLQDQNAREKENSAQLRERLAKAAQVVRVAGGLLDSQGRVIGPDSRDVGNDVGPGKKNSQEAS
jgi:CheY-like chemotaxis protein